MQAVNVLISQDMAESLVPGNFAHVIFSTGGLKGSPELLVSARLPPLINVGCIPLIKLLAQQYLALSFYLFCALNCSLCWASQMLGAWPAPESSAPIYYFRGGGWLECLKPGWAERLLDARSKHSCSEVPTQLMYFGLIENTAFYCAC